MNAAALLDVIDARAPDALERFGCRESLSGYSPADR